MKQKQITILSVVVIIIIGILIWFKNPIDMTEINPEEIMEIAIFDGNTGSSLHITDKEDISYIIGNLNTIKLKRQKLSFGYTGYSFKTTIYGRNGEEIDGWNNFIINSKDTIRKDPFFYDVVEGGIDYQHIETLIEEENMKQKIDLIPMVMVNGELYLDTGKESDFDRKCGTMDGDITSTVESFEEPTKDDQSNFGSGYGYQFVSPKGIDILINEKWFRFEKESKDMVDKNYERISEYMKEHSIATFSPYYELLDFQTMQKIVLMKV